jgi:hypothetical protein
MTPVDPSTLPPEVRDLALPAGAPLPDDLAVLGARLEAAAARKARRRALRGSILNGLFVVLVGAPLALAAAATDLGPSSEPVDRVARDSSALASFERSRPYIIQHVPDLSIATAAGRPCAEVPGCRVPGRGAPFAPVRLRTLY